MERGMIRLVDQAKDSETCTETGNTGCAKSTT